MAKLTVGRIVHYWPDDGKDPLAALVVKVWSETCCNLIVFGDGTGPRGSWGDIGDQGTRKTSVPIRDEHNDRNVWSWPERV